MSCKNNCGNTGGLFGDWIWIIIAIVIVLCLFGDNNNGLFGSNCCDNDCC